MYDEEAYDHSITVINCINELHQEMTGRSDLGLVDCDVFYKFLLDKLQWWGATDTRGDIVFDNLLYCIVKNVTDRYKNYKDSKALNSVDVTDI